MGAVEEIYNNNASRIPFRGKRQREVLSLSEFIRKEKTVFGISVIGEYKRKSPSGFNNTENTDIREYANALLKLNVSGISVLTEPDFFNGSYDDIRTVSGLGVPILDKDFISTFEMVDSAYNSGADCILLIADFLEEDKIKKLSAYSRRLGMEVLAEFHDQECINRIPEDEGVIMGYNRRNLRTLSMEGKEMEIIDTLKDKEVISVLESGLVPSEIPDSTRREFDAFLIGESLLKERRREAASQ